MEVTKEQFQALVARTLQMQEQERADKLEAALASIEFARKELVEVQHQLVAAAAGQPYLRIGEIRGVDAGAVFGAFGAVERLAQLQKSIAQELEQ